MDAKTIYDELLKQGIPEKLVRWSNKADSIDMLIQDYNEKVYKEALKFFKDYKGVRVDYTIDHETALLCDDVSKYSSDELIRSLTDFYYTLRTKGLAYTESKKSMRKSIKKSSDVMSYQESKNQQEKSIEESLDIEQFINLFIDAFSVIFLFSQRKNIKKALGYKENESIIKTLIMNVKKALEEMNDDSTIN